MEKLILFGLAILLSGGFLIHYVVTFDSNRSTRTKENRFDRENTTMQAIRILGTLFLFIIALYVFITELIK